jgi:hypothetical protein
MGMKVLRIIAGLWLAIAILGGRCPTYAEEIILKNGQKIIGTIVGYEKDMFRVETDYGIALVRKDRIASIQVSKPDVAASSPQAPPPPDPKSNGEKPTHVVAAPDAAPTAAPPAPTPMAAKPSSSVPAVAKPAAASAIADRKSTIANSDSPNPAPPAPTPMAAKPVVPAKPPTPPPPPASHPLDVPMPANLQEHVEGNTYFSDTFQFSMFKPPDWKIFEGVPKETGSGIMAMGTDDEQTLLIVDRQVWSGAPKLTSDQVEARLRQTYQNYHRISEDAFECDGQTATHRTFTGVLDSAEWHGVAVHVIHGNTVFGIIGLTSAETFQFQEAIFNKIIKTFHFHNPTAAPPTTKPAS